MKSVMAGQLMQVSHVALHTARLLFPITPAYGLLGILGRNAKKETAGNSICSRILGSGH